MLEIQTLRSKNFGLTVIGTDRQILTQIGAI